MLSPYWLLTILTILVLSTRLLPLSISEYPYNNDSITECRIADDIIERSSFSPPADSFYTGTHSVVTIAHNAVLAFTSTAIGCSVFDVAQFATAAFSLVTVIGGFVLGYLLTGSRKGALAGALFLATFGTFVFLTGSAWKESLGIALLMLFFFAYAHRSERRMMALEILILLTLPLVHHIVTLTAFLALAYLTVWSVVNALRVGRLRRRHYADMVVIAVPAVLAYGYYKVEDLDRLSYMSSGMEIASLLLAFSVLCVVMVLVLSKKSHSRLSFAPIPAVALLMLLTWDYFHPIFSYVPGYPRYVLLLVTGSCAVVCVAWLGFEETIESRSMFRAVPLGMLLPALTLLLFAVIGGFSLRTHQIIYRTIDFGDLALAVGVAAGVAHFRSRPKAEWFIVVSLILALLLTFPFGYASAGLLGMRHDTQSYEVQAIEWVTETGGLPPMFESDERVSYTAMALFDYEKRPFLPTRLYGDYPFYSDTVYAYEEEWSVVGVNNYPNGHPTIDETKVSEVIGSCNLIYIGGPVENNLLLFVTAL